MLTQLSRVLFGPPRRRVPLAPGQAEWHVDRRLNVLASAAAHAKYFADADAIFLDLFNREPMDAQPEFVADMGCGDGSWLKHAYETITRHTKRGRALSRYPLLMVGADSNEASLDVARQTLAAASVPSLVLFGDVTDPDRFALDLRQHGLDITRGLHIRSFIDHNRQYRPLVEAAAGDGRGCSSGAYVDDAGQTIPNRLVEEDLVRFLGRWIPYVKTHGLVILEAHCVEPRIAARHIGELHNISFDAYHGLSHQYPVDFAIFMQAARRAGLEPVLYHHRRYPSRKPFVSISLNRFVVSAEATAVPAARPAAKHLAEWRADGSEDLRDGEALHRLLYHGGDLRRPRSWSAYSTGVLLHRAVACLARRVDDIRKGKRPPVLAVMDYGTGTGMFALELLKACEETGLLRPIEDLNVQLRIHLLDIPSGWFAKGYALLRECPYVRFVSLRDAAGHFVPLRRIVGRNTIDLAIASMVFHLIPPRALGGVFEGLAEVLKEDGTLLWNAPDLGPPLPASDLFHEPNRRLRRLALEAIDDGTRLRALLERFPSRERRLYADLPAELERVRAALTPQKRAEAERLANRQVMPTPTTAAFVEAERRRLFSGQLFFQTFEICTEESLDAILVPANQRCLDEIEDREVRRRLTMFLMTHDVMPAMNDGPAGTSRGFNVHWTFGDWTPRRGQPSAP
jgi:SAM-dependent methyltransferase